PDAGRAYQGLSLLRRRLRHRRHFAASARLDAGAGGATAARGIAACRARTTARRARSSRPARATARRLSRAAEEPVLPARSHAVLVEADAGDPRPAYSLADGSRSRAAGRLCLPARAAGEARVARSLLCRHAADVGARSASARRLHGVGRAYARRT